MTSLELLDPAVSEQRRQPPKRIIGAEKTVEPVNVSVGSPGGIVFVYRTFRCLSSRSRTVSPISEIDRKTHIKRVENPDDPSQFVDVERIDQIALRNKLNPDDKRIYEIKNKD